MLHFLLPIYILAGLLQGIHWNQRDCFDPRYMLLTRNKKDHLYNINTLTKWILTFHSYSTGWGTTCFCVDTMYIEDLT